MVCCPHLADTIGSTPLGQLAAPAAAPPLLSPSTPLVTDTAREAGGADGGVVSHATGALRSRELETW